MIGQKNIASSVDGKIPDKAYLSRKDIQDITLPDDTIHIGAWAFAHAKNLKEITIPSNNISVGKDCFLDCPALTRIQFTSGDNVEGLPELFATGVTKLNDMSLFRPDLASHTKTQSNWFKMYDVKLIEYINEPDAKGFSAVLYGWFNDTGEDEQQLEYVNNRRAEKVRLCYLRLLYDAFLQDNERKVIADYLRSHMLNTEHSEEHTLSFDILINELSNNIDYIKVADENTIIDDFNRNELLEILSSMNVSPEIIAFLLKNSNKSQNPDSIFDSLTI